MQRYRLFLLLIVLVLVGTPAAAQNSCERPFEDVSIRFSNGFWARTDFCTTSIDLAEVISGGPPPNAIPPIGFPEWEDPLNPGRVIPALPGPVYETLEAGRAWLQDQSPVVVVEMEGDARAYPLAILIWHEIVNDTVGGVPLVVTYCPLCNSAIVFERRIDEAELYFGTTGNLRNSDLIMWDDRTQSWWQQFTGEAIVGEYTGTMLTMLPSHLASFAEFATQYPQGQVLSRETGTSRQYGSNPYEGYDSGSPFLFEGQADPRLPATARVLAGSVGGQPIAFDFALLQAQGVVNDLVAEQPIVAFWQDGQASALDTRTIDTGRAVGTAALYSRVLGEQTLTFIAEDGIITDEQTGSTWNVFGRAVSGPLMGQQLRQMLAGPHLWFAWAAFKPDTIVRVNP
jgi:hypothetical protein